jgi:predicted dinucleotide-binding enzyme
MKRKAQQRISRRKFNRALLATGVGVGLGPGFLHSTINAQTSNPLKIGIIGSGRIGGAVGLRWAEAGHQILFSSRNPDGLTDLVSQAGANASAGYPSDAARFGDIVFIAVPYAALPQVGRDFSALMAGKIVIECGNPVPNRDGPMADAAIARGTGVASAEFLPGVRLVRAFNAVSFVAVNQEAHREGELIGIPLAGDDAEAIEVATRLIVDSGFDPVFVGGLERARDFDRGTNVYVKGMTASQIRDTLGI